MIQAGVIDNINIYEYDHLARARLDRAIACYAAARAAFDAMATARALHEPQGHLPPHVGMADSELNRVALGLSLDVNEFKKTADTLEPFCAKDLRDALLVLRRIVGMAYGATMCAVHPGARLVVPQAEDQLKAIPTLELHHEITNSIL